MRQWTDDDLDRLIDDTARGMTARPAPSDLAARVRARLEAPRRRWTWAIAAPLAAAAAALVVFMVNRPPRTATPAAAPIARSGPGAPSLARPSPSAVPPAPIVARVREAPGRRSTRLRTIVARAPLSPSPIDALAPPALAIAPVALTPNLVAPLEDEAPLDIRELPMTSIAVAPLAADDSAKEKP